VLRYLRRLEIRSETDGSAGEPHLEVKLAQLKEEMGKLTAHGRRMVARPMAGSRPPILTAARWQRTGAGSGVVGYNHVAVGGAYYLIVTQAVRNVGNDTTHLAALREMPRRPSRPMRSR